MEADNLSKETDRQITVIIPVYNCKEFLEQAVESVISQSYKTIKIILVDDGSTDGSSLLCDELANQDKRIDVLHQKNSGVSEARNAGLRLILSDDGNENDYITFLDADDVWKADWLTPQIKELMGEGIDLIGLQACTCDHLLTRRSKEVHMQEGEYKGGISSIWLHASQPMGAMLYRVNFIKQYNIRFYSISASEDKIFSMQCLYLADKIYLVNQLMYFYRQNMGSAVHTRNRGISYFIPIIANTATEIIEPTTCMNPTIVFPILSKRDAPDASVVLDGFQLSGLKLEALPVLPLPVAPVPASKLAYTSLFNVNIPNSKITSIIIVFKKLNFIFIKPFPLINYYIIILAYIFILQEITFFFNINI